MHNIRSPALTPPLTFTKVRVEPWKMGGVHKKVKLPSDRPHCKKNVVKKENVLVHQRQFKLRDYKLDNIKRKVKDLALQMIQFREGPGKQGLEVD